jgi:catechol 2,3-dioxygenase-like lactoylglutathione lyase family enzyme
MVPTKLDHCVIKVTDWARSNKFYGEVMGAELVQSGNSDLCFERNGPIDDVIAQDPWRCV